MMQETPASSVDKDTEKKQHGPLRTKYASYILAALVIIGLFAGKHFGNHIYRSWHDEVHRKAFTEGAKYGHAKAWADAVKLHDEMAEKNDSPVVVSSNSQRPFAVDIELEDIAGCRHGLFEDVETLVLHAGYPRSAHTLVGALLDAHPNVALAASFNLIEVTNDHGESRLQGGKNTNNLFRDMLYDVIQRWVSNKPREIGYSYNVPGQWQGKFSCLKVIGDKKGGSIANAAEEDMEELQRKVDWIEEHANVTVKFIHVLRNPYDIIATMTTRKLGAKGAFYNVELNETVKEKWDEREIPKKTAMFKRLYENNKKYLSTLPADRVLTVHGADLIAEPQKEIPRWCQFFNIPCSDIYVNACASILFKKPHRSRDVFDWPKKFTKEFDEYLSQQEDLSRYSFKSD